MIVWFEDGQTGRQSWNALSFHDHTSPLWRVSGGTNKPGNVNLGSRGRIKGSPLSLFRWRNHKDATGVLLPALSSERKAALC